MKDTENNQPKIPSSGSGLIEKIIRRYIGETDVVFVFPTEIAADMWQERSLGFYPQAVLPDERFLPWDRFKSFHAGVAESGKAEVTARVRELYAERLAEESASSIPTVIPTKFAESASLFSTWIASILPHLALWKERIAQAGRARDVEDRDIEFIFKDYKAFLERTSLFEPSWCRRFEGDGKKYIIFFYEAIEGFSSYSHALGINSNSDCLDVEKDALPDAKVLKDFTAVKAPSFVDEETQSRLHSVKLYDDFREEFRRIALKIEELLAQGESADTIAVSLSDAEESAPYLARELETRGIPFYLRFGRPIAETGAGRIFPLIQQCGAEDFSFNSVKKLLSLKSIAWLSPELPARLVQFGIDNRCLCSWEEDGKNVDAWERALSAAPKETDFRIKDWYKKLKENVEGLCSAKSFADTRKAWFAFSKNLLDLEKMRDDSKGDESKENREIGRCIKELNELVEAEQSYRLTPKSPFSFFVARLKKTTYVSQSKEGGVSVFKLNDAAAAPFKFHFVTGATQEDATPLHTELRFLRKDKRDALDPEEDASLHLFSSYVNGAESDGSIFFSASKRGVGGYKTVHSAFAVIEAKDEAGDAPLDPLEMEERQERPPYIYPVQEKGFKAYSWLNADKAGRFSFLKEGFEEKADEAALINIKERIAQKQKAESGVVRVSATDLKDYAACPAKWFMKKVLELDKIGFAPAPDLVDSLERGNIFHKVVATLYNLIREKDGTFRKEHSEDYKREADKIISDAIKESLRRSSPESPLAEPSRQSEAARLKDGVVALIDADSELLDGFIPVMTEKEVCSSGDGIEYKGRIDRISESEGGESIVIADYKTGWNLPGAKDWKPDDDGKIEDFQMPLYAFLCKKELEKDVTQAWFFSVKEQKYTRILDTDDGVIKPSSRYGCKSQKEFEVAIKAMKKEADRFAESVNTASFCAKDVYSETCEECAFRTVCRHDYSVAQD